MKNIKELNSLITLRGGAESLQVLSIGNTDYLPSKNSYELENSMRLSSLFLRSITQGNKKNLEVRTKRINDDISLHSNITKTIVFTDVRNKMIAVFGIENKVSQFIFNAAQSDMDAVLMTDLLTKDQWQSIEKRFVEVFEHDASLVKKAEVFFEKQKNKHFWYETFIASLLLWTNQTMGHLSDSSIAETISQLGEDLTSLFLVTISIEIPALISFIQERMRRSIERPTIIENKDTERLPIVEMVSSFSLLYTNLLMGHLSEQEKISNAILQIGQDLINPSIVGIAGISSIVIGKIISTIRENTEAAEFSWKLIGTSIIGTITFLYANQLMGHVSSNNISQFSKDFINPTIATLAIGAGGGLAFGLEHFRLKKNKIAKYAQQQINRVFAHWTQ